MTRFYVYTCFYLEANCTPEIDASEIARDLSPLMVNPCELVQWKKVGILLRVLITVFVHV